MDGAVELVEHRREPVGAHQFLSPPKGDAGAQPVTTALRLPAGEISTSVELLPVLPLGAARTTSMRSLVTTGVRPIQGGDNARLITQRSQVQILSRYKETPSQGPIAISATGP
jgi:hypothetical protein